MSHHAHLDRAVGGHLVAARVHHRLALGVLRPVADLYTVALELFCVLVKHRAHVC